MPDETIEGCRAHRRVIRRIGGGNRSGRAEVFELGQFRVRMRARIGAAATMVNGRAKGKSSSSD
jgi:hypothetical protein